MLRCCALVLLVAARGSALRAPARPPAAAAPVVGTAALGRRPFVAGLAAAVAVAPAVARAGDLSPASQLADELSSLRAEVRAGRANGKRATQVLDRTIRPLANAFAKNPYNEKTDYGGLVAQKMATDVDKLAAALAAPDGFAPLRGSTGDVSYPGGTVEKTLTSMVESAEAYCQLLDCDNLLIYR